MKALQSISSHNKAIELKIEQQNRKADVQVQEISERFENLGPHVNKQAAQIESQLKLHEDKLAAKINVFEEEFSNTLAFLNAKAQILQGNCLKESPGNTRQARFEAKCCFYKRSTVNKRQHSTQRNLCMFSRKLRPKWHGPLVF